MSKLSQIRILVVDDEPDMAQLLALMLRRDYQDIITAPNGQTGIEKALTHKPDVIVTDLMMPEVDGFTLIKRVFAENLRIPIIVVTAYASMDTAVQALRLGAFDFLSKPVDTQVARDTVAKAAKKRLAERKEFWEQEILSAVSASRDLKQIINTLLTLSAQALGAEAGLVWWPDNFAPETYLNPADEALKALLIHWGQHMDLMTFSDRKNAVALDSSLEFTGSAIGLSLLTHNSVHCVLTLTHSQKGYFDDFDASLLQDIMPFAALSIDNAKIYNNLKAANQRLSTLQSINALTYNANLPLNRILRLTVEGIRQNLGYSVAMIALPDRSGHSLTLQAAAGSLDKFLKRKGDTPTQHIAFAVSDNNNPFSITYNTKMIQDLPVSRWSAALRQANAPEMAQALENQKAARCLAFPVWQGENVIGTLVVGHNHSGPLPASESTLLTTLANQIALVVTNATLYQAEQQGRREMSALYEAGLVITSSLSRDEVLKRIVQQLVDLTKIQSCIIGRWNPQKNLELVELYLQQSPRGLQEKESPGTVYPLPSRPAVKKALETQEPVLIEINDADIAEAEKTWMFEADVRQRLIIPLVIRDKSIGVVELMSNQTETVFSSQIIRIAQGLVAQASIAIENSRLHESEIKRLEDEMDLAQRIQISLLPHETPSIPGLNIAARTVSARLVGGDFYRYLSLPNDQFGVVIGDVSGKGVPSALYMAITITAMDGQIRKHSSPGEMLYQLNDALYPRMQANGMNTGLLVAIFDITHQKLEIANAGMIAPLIQHQRGLTWLDVSGFPVGAVPHTRYFNKTLSLAEQSTIILASDGIIEAKNPAGEIYGFPRFQESAQTSLNAGDSQAILEHLWQDVTRFTKDAEQHDDMTLLIIKTE